MGVFRRAAGRHRHLFRCDQARAARIVERAGDAPVPVGAGRWPVHRRLLRHRFCQHDRLARLGLSRSFSAQLLRPRGAALRRWRFPARREGAHTANAGKIYFPSGTPDLDDVIGDAVDLDGSVIRELTEETGLGAGDVTPASGWHAVFAGPRIGMMKILQSAEPATALRIRILAFLAQQATPELADVRIVRSSADYDPMMPSFITTFLDEIWK